MIKYTGRGISEEVKEKDLFLGYCKEGGKETKNTETHLHIWGEESDRRPAYHLFFSM